jgi:general secretion pathway protein M
MKAWFESLDLRERRLLIGGGVLLLALLLYVAIWEPLVNKVDGLRASTVEQQAVLAEMRQMALEVKRLGGGKRTVRPASGRSLLSLVDSTAKSARLGDALKRVQPDGEQRVQVWLEGVSFDQLVSWLVTLEQRQGVRAVSSVFEAKDESGRVDARLVFEAAV